MFQRFKHEAGLPLCFEERLQVKPFPLKNTKLHNNKFLHHKTFERHLIKDLYFLATSTIGMSYKVHVFDNIFFYIQDSGDIGIMVKRTRS